MMEGIGAADVGRLAKELAGIGCMGGITELQLASRTLLLKSIYKLRGLALVDTRCMEDILSIPKGCVDFLQQFDETEMNMGQTAGCEKTQAHVRENDGPSAASKSVAMSSH